MHILCPLLHCLIYIIIPFFSFLLLVHMFILPALLFSSLNILLKNWNWNWSFPSSSISKYVKRQRKRVLVILYSGWQRLWPLALYVKNIGESPILYLLTVNTISWSLCLSPAYSLGFGMILFLWENYSLFSFGHIFYDPFRVCDLSWLYTSVYFN